ncbi:hypothetical protein CR513_53632, partial [Mucuna pruriens]
MALWQSPQMRKFLVIRIGAPGVRFIIYLILATSFQRLALAYMFESNVYDPSFPDSNSNKRFAANSPSSTFECNRQALSKATHTTGVGSIGISLMSFIASPKRPARPQRSTMQA